MRKYVERALRKNRDGMLGIARAVSEDNNFAMANSFLYNVLLFNIYLQFPRKQHNLFSQGTIGLI